jgi:hypothetical protein
MGHSPTVPVVLDYLAKRVGQSVSIGEITDATKLTEKQVQAAIQNARSRHGCAEAIEVVFRGRQWRYDPTKTKQSASTGKRMFEEIGASSKTGVLILECEDGTLWKAEQI